MKYASIIIGVIILLVIVGLLVAFVPRYGGVAAIPDGRVVSYNYGLAPVNYQASVLGTAVAPAPTMQVAAQVPVVNAGYPYPNNTYGTVPSVPVVPVVWYTAPSQPMTYLYGVNGYNTSRTTVIYPQQQQGSTQVYTYSNPGSSNGYQYQYAQNGATQTGYNNGVWYQ